MRRDRRYLTRWARNPDEIYEREWASKIEKLSRGNPRPFNKWFNGQERIYFPFDPEHILDLTEKDEEVIHALEDAGYSVHDYKGGYCRRRGYENVQRIGKVLNNLKRKDLQEIREAHERGELYNLRKKTAETERYYDDLFTSFSSSSFRRAAEIAKLYVVISQNPHDIARMSTGRNWESCMTLGSGSNHPSIFQEVQSGGLVAYLIRSDDLNIDKPLARVHIRHFKGQISIAKTEDSVYGEDVPGFKEAVDDWIESRQGHIPGGLYRLSGGNYSDSYQKIIRVGGSWELPPVSDVDATIRVYKGIGLEDLVYKEWIVTLDGSISHRIDEEGGEDIEYTFLDKYLADSFIEAHELNQWDDWRESEDDGCEEPYWTEVDDNGEYIREPLTIREKVVDDRPEMQMQAASQIINAPKGMYPQDILLDIKKKYPGLSQTLRLKYPEIFTSEEIKKLLGTHDYTRLVASLPEAERAPYLKQADIQLIELVENPANFLPPCVVCEQPVNPETDPVVACENHLMLHHAHCPNVCQMTNMNNSHRGVFVIANILNTYVPLLELRSSRQIPEPIIRKLITLPERTYFLGRKVLEMKSCVLHLLYMARSDTPAVQNFYESLLPYWEYEFEPRTGDGFLQPRLRTIIDIDNLGFAIAKLGENGKRFLPFVRDRLARLEHDFGPLIFNPNIETPPKDFIPTEWQIRRFSNVNQIWWWALRVAEKYLYIVDSIESGKGYSTKYDSRR